MTIPPSLPAHEAVARSPWPLEALPPSFAAVQMRETQPQRRASQPEANGPIDPASLRCDTCGEPYGSFIVDSFTGRARHRTCPEPQDDLPPGQPLTEGANELSARQLADAMRKPVEPPPLR